MANVSNKANTISLLMLHILMPVTMTVYGVFRKLLCKKIESCSCKTFLDSFFISSVVHTMSALLKLCFGSKIQI